MHKPLLFFSTTLPSLFTPIPLHLQPNTPHSTIPSHTLPNLSINFYNTLNISHITHFCFSYFLLKKNNIKILIMNIL